MKKLLLLILLAGCGGNSDTPPPIVEPPKPVEPNYTLQSLGELTYRDVTYNGVIDHLNDNSWVFTSHTNDTCVGSPNVLKSKCRKVNFSYIEGNKVDDRVTKLTFEFNLSDMNVNGDLDWNIIYQDWVRLLPLPPTQLNTDMKKVLVDQDGHIHNQSIKHMSQLKFNKVSSATKSEYDSNGNHPITTLKLKLFNNEPHVCHYDNSWQWGYDFGDNREGDAIDVDHSLHPQNRLNGCLKIDPQVDYNLTLITYDSGRIIFKADGDVISDVKYQTKHTDIEAYSQHIIQFGQYWNKGFNIENDPLNRVVLRIDNLLRYGAVL